MQRYALPLAALALLLAPLAQAAPWPARVDDYIAQQKQGIPSISMEQLKAIIDKGDGSALIIDVREPDEFARGHVPGAINIPRGQLEFRIWGLLGYPNSIAENQTIYTYCSLGGRAALSARALQNLGLKNTAYVDMRIVDWKDMGYPLQK